MGGNPYQTPGATGDQGPITGSDDLLSGVDLEFLRSNTEAAVTTGLQKTFAELGASKDVLENSATIFAWLAHALGDWILKAEKEGMTSLQPVLNAIVELITTLLLPFASSAGELSKVFVSMIAGGIGKGTGGAGEQAGQAAGVGAQYAYDNICAPLAGITGATPPTNEGAGAANIQRTLGAIVSTHLITWVINVISNLTGFGVLKYFNSFNEVITSALNVRGMSRLCMKPYMDTMITKPATHELNSQWPLNFTSEASIAKAYLRGAYTADQFRSKMRAEGYDDTWATQALLDAAKELSIANVAWLVRTNAWTETDAAQYLINTGFDPRAASIALFQELNSLVIDLNKRAADALGAHFATGELDESSYLAALQKMGFTQNEQTAYRNLYALEREFTKPLTYTQVTNLYKDSLVDLNFVRSWMLTNGNSADDADLLILLDFTEADQRQARKNALGAAARLAAVKASEEAATKKALGDAALAAAYQQLADKKAAFASSLGQ